MMIVSRTTRKLRIALVYSDAGWRASTFFTALNDLGFVVTRIDIYAGSWLADIRSFSPDLIIAFIPADAVERYISFCDRIAIIERQLNIPVYPGPLARALYENKQVMGDFLECNGYPSAKLHVFVSRRAALDFARQAPLPIVLKSNFGSGSSGVEVIIKRRRLRRVVGRHFSRIHPYFSWGYAKPIKSKKFFLPLPVPGRRQRNVVILQDYVKVKWEWRVVRIGSRYYGHRKLLAGYYASGTLKKAWGMPPDKILNMVRTICHGHDLPVLCVDIFETEDGRFVINELQCQFGHSTDELMKVDGQSGCAMWEGGRWVFVPEHAPSDKSARAIIHAYIDHFRGHNSYGVDGGVDA